MAEETAPDGLNDGGVDEPKKKRGLLVPLLLGANLALVVCGGVAFAVMSGAFAPPAMVADLLGGAPKDADASEAPEGDGGKNKAAAKSDGDKEKGDGDGDNPYAASIVQTPTGPTAFVPLEPLTVTLTRSGAPRQLRVSIVIETPPPHRAMVSELTPRIKDSLNTLLRAVDQGDLADPAAFDRLRAQLLRRVKLAVDPSMVTDLLITEYVIF